MTKLGDNCDQYIAYIAMNRSQNKRTDKLMDTLSDEDKDVMTDDKHYLKMTCNKTSVDITVRSMVYTIILVIFLVLLLLSLIPVTGADLPIQTQPDYKQSSSDSLNVCQKCRLLCESFTAVIV